MNRSRQNIEKLAILNAWVTSFLVILILLTVFITVNLKALRTWRSLTLSVFMTGTLGGAASNYRRLQEAYVQQLGKSTHELESSTIHVIEESQLKDSSAAKEGVVTLSAPVEQKVLPIDDKSTLLLLKLQIFLSPLFGSLFAFVLYGVFASGIIQGELFPRFQGTEEEYSTVYEFAYITVPATNGDAAKAILWAFIAGFAEGFVPNFIDKLVKDADIQ